MRTHATAQLIGDRTHQCDATATASHPSGARAYVLLDGIGSSDEVAAFARATARRVARACARTGSAEAGLRQVYDALADDPARHDPFSDLPAAAAVAAVAAPGRPLQVAWCGDSRAYFLPERGRLEQWTADHNLRRLLMDQGRTPWIGSRNRITSYLGNTAFEPEPDEPPLIESVTRPARRGRLLLASDGAYEPLEDSCRDLAAYLDGDPAEAAHDFVDSALELANHHADNATVLVADIAA